MISALDGWMLYERRKPLAHVRAGFKEERNCFCWDGSRACEVEKKGGSNIQTPKFKKGQTVLHEKCHFLLNMEFLVNEINNYTLNFT
jgi:hypothetical protein